MEPSRVSNRFSSRSVALLAFILVTGCQASSSSSGLVGQGDRALSQKRYGEAMADYDAELARSRVDEDDKGGIASKRDNARRLWVEDEVKRAGKLRSDGKAEQAFGVLSTLAREAASKKYAPQVVAVISAELDKTSLVLWQGVESAQKERSYVQAVSLGERLAELTDNGSTTRRKLDELRREAHEFYSRRFQASTQPGEAFAEAVLVKRFGEKAPRSPLLDTLATLAGLSWSVRVSGSSCEATPSSRPRSTSGSESVSATMQIDSCGGKDRHWTQQETKAYTRTETYTTYTSEQKCKQVEVGTQICHQDKYYNTTCEPRSVVTQCETVQTPHQNTREINETEQVSVEYVEVSYAMSGEVSANFDGQRFSQRFNYSNQASDHGWSGGHTSKSMSVPSIGSFISSAASAASSALSSVESQIQSSRAQKVLARAANEEDPHALIHAHMLASLLRGSAAPESRKVLARVYALRDAEVDALVRSNLDASLAPQLAYAFKLDLPTPDKDSVASARENDDIADYAEDSEGRAPLLLGVSQVNGNAGGSATAVWLGGEVEYANRDNTGLLIGLRIPLELGLDTNGDLGGDLAAAFQLGVRLRGFGIAGIARGGLDGMGSHDSFVVPFALHYGGGGRVSARWLPWEIEASFVHLLRMSDPPEFQADVEREERAELRVIRYFASESALSLGARYTEYDVVGKTIGGAIYYTF